MKKDAILRTIAISRLSDLGCEQLPPSVLDLIIEGFVKRAEHQLKRLSKRELTIPKIAKLFAHGLSPEGVLEGGPKGAPSNEMRPANDAFSSMRQGS
jgi:hypothetical protein